MVLFVNSIIKTILFLILFTLASKGITCSAIRNIHITWTETQKRNIVGRYIYNIM